MIYVPINYIIITCINIYAFMETNNYIIFKNKTYYNTLLIPTV